MSQANYYQKRAEADAAAKPQVIREHPNAPEFNRFQVGANVDRAEMEMVYEGNHAIGLRPTGRRVTVFKLQGWGGTLQSAQVMAGGAK